MNKTYISIDLGASSGRIIVSELKNENIKSTLIHRFKNKIIFENNIQRWDFQYLFQEILLGLKIIFKSYPNIVSIGIDSWGCDFGIIDEFGNLIENPVTYRDLNVFNYINKVHSIIDKKTLYSLTGIQHLPFNTIYQLAYANQRLNLNNKKILLIPDLISYFLTGNMFTERTNASTTSLYNPNTSTWVSQIKELGLNENIFSDFISPGETYGYLKEEFLKKFGVNYDIPIVAVASHDTASAYIGANLSSDEILISSGTWSLIGIESKTPIINDFSFENNFSNEVGLNNIRYLKNTMGMWMINRVLEEYRKIGSIYDFKEINKLAKINEDFLLYIDVDNKDFINPTNMLEAINKYSLSENKETLLSPGKVFITIYKNMILKYKEIINHIEQITNKNYKVIKIIGGGSKNIYLNNLLQKTVKKEVIVGPTEATTLGNLIIQLKRDNIDYEFLFEKPYEIMEKEKRK